MTEPMIFDGTSPRFGLPLLFAGQAQKELFVNEAHALVDAMLHCTIEGETSAPPSSPADGEAWLVGSEPSGDWSGRAGAIAARQAGQWLFIAPRAGFRVWDRSTRQERFYDEGWQSIMLPLEPIGGSTVDVEARAAIGDLISALRAAGVFPAA